MNNFTGTGWLQKDAWKATVPTSFQQIVSFDIYLAHDDGVDGREAAPWRCEVSNLALIQRHEAKLVAGAALIIQGQLRAKPFVDHYGVHKGFSRYIHLDSIEFSRLPAAATQPEPAHHETTTARQ